MPIQRRPYQVPTVPIEQDICIFRNDLPGQKSKGWGFGQKIWEDVGPSMKFLLRFS